VIFLRSVLKKGRYALMG